MRRSKLGDLSIGEKIGFTVWFLLMGVVVLALSASIVWFLFAFTNWVNRH